MMENALENFIIIIMAIGAVVGNCNGSVNIQNTPFLTILLIILCQIHHLLPLPDMSQHRVRLQHLKLTKVAHVPVVMEQVCAQCVKEKEAITPIPAHIQVRVQKHGINFAHAMDLGNVECAMVEAL